MLAMDLLSLLGSIPAVHLTRSGVGGIGMAVGAILVSVLVILGSLHLQNLRAIIVAMIVQCSYGCLRY